MTFHKRAARTCLLPVISLALYEMPNPEVLQTTVNRRYCAVSLNMYFLGLYYRLIYAYNIIQCKRFLAICPTHYSFWSPTHHSTTTFFQGEIHLDSSQSVWFRAIKLLRNCTHLIYNYRLLVCTWNPLIRYVANHAVCSMHAALKLADHYTCSSSYSMIW